MHVATHDALSRIPGSEGINSGRFGPLFCRYQAAYRSERMQEIARPIQSLRGGYDGDSKQQSGSYTFRHGEETEEEMPSGEHKLYHCICRLYVPKT
jgi:hypothetical protein